MNPSIFREYDIRGIADTDLASDSLQHIARAISRFFISKDVATISLGRDCRTSSPRIHEILSDELLNFGINVIDIGLVSTPMIYFSLFHLKVGGGIMITGSHNPGEYNGLKVCLGQSTIHGDAIQEIYRFTQEVPTPSQKGIKRGACTLVDLKEPYTAAIRQSIGETLSPIKVVVDSGNGMAAGIAAEIYRGLGCQVIDLFPELDGNFPNHHPDPTQPENLTTLIKAIANEGADLGIAFDGDADRIGVVDPSGKIFYGDELLILCARDILKINPGAKIISEVKASRKFFTDIADKGGFPILWKTGHSLIKEKMKEEKALLAGEMSGHMFFNDRWYGFDDAIYAGARVLQILSHQKSTAAELLSDLPDSFTTPEIRVDCPDEIKFDVVNRAIRAFKDLDLKVVDIDGARIEFEDGWGLVRASNTQPVLVFRYEASTQGRLADIRKLIEGVVDQETCRLREKSLSVAPESTISKTFH